MSRSVTDSGMLRVLVLQCLHSLHFHVIVQIFKSLFRDLESCFADRCPEFAFEHCAPHCTVSWNGVIAREDLVSVTHVHVAQLVNRSLVIDVFTDRRGVTFKTPSNLESLRARWFYKLRERVDRHRVSSMPLPTGTAIISVPSLRIENPGYSVHIILSNLLFSHRTSTPLSP